MVGCTCLYPALLGCSQCTIVFCRTLVSWWKKVVAWRKRKEAMLSTIATKEMLAAHLFSCIWWPCDLQLWLPWSNPDNARVCLGLQVPMCSCLISVLIFNLSSCSSMENNSSSFYYQLWASECITTICMISYIPPANSSAGWWTAMDEKVDCMSCGGRECYHKGSTSVAWRNT